MQKRLKTVRHHGVVKYLASIETAEEFIVATEHVLPLSLVLNSMSFEEVLLGLYQLIVSIIRVIL